MKITYNPSGINNFHNCAAANVIVTGEKREDCYTISKHQARRLTRHFCGIRDCCCPAGAVREVTPMVYGLPARYVRLPEGQTDEN